MIVIQPYNNSTSEQPLFKIYSNQGYFIRKGSLVYQEAIISEKDEKNDFIETQTPIPAPIASKEYVYDTLCGELNNITIQQVDNAQAILQKALRSLSDKDAYEVKFLFKPWQSNVEYVIGDRVSYHGELYNVISVPVSGEAPDVNTMNYSKTELPDDLIEEWDSVNRKTYQMGDKVKIGEHYYESLVNDNNWSPIEFPTSWKLIQ